MPTAPRLPLARFSAPRLSRILDRPRLYRLLDRSLRRSVLWVVAPPGAGKTVLVASWLRHRRLRHLWLQLDEGDSDVATFYHHLSLAAGPCRGRAGLPAFTPEYLAAPGGFARRFFRQLGAGARAPTAIVLDDYHELPGGSPVHAALRDGLGELPQSVAMVVMSRSEPPPSLARLWVRGALETVGSDLLALTQREARSIAGLWGYTGRDLELVLSLHGRAQGWAAGLVLLLAGWRDSGCKRAGVVDTVLFDFFGEEVLAQASPQARAVLLETAFLPRVAADMAVHLTGISQAGEILADLSRRGYFVERHDGAAPGYQVHALFREFLARRAAQCVTPARRAELRLAAAGHLEAAGDHEEALPLYAQAGAWADAARALRSVAPGLLHQGRAETVARWVLSLPRDIREADPWLRLWLGAARCPIDPAGARASLESAFEQFERTRDPTGLALAWSAVVEGYFYELDNLAGLDRWLLLLDEVLRRHPGRPGPEVEARLVGAAFGALVNRQPWNPRLRVWEERALALAVSPANPALQLPVARALAVYYGWWAMDLDKARLVLEALRPSATGKHADPADGIFWWIAQANLHIHLARPDACFEAVEHGLAIAAESGLHQWDALLLQLRCLGEAMRGDLAAASRALEAVRTLGEATAPPTPRLRTCAYHYTASVLARLRGDMGLAREHGQIALDMAVEGGMPLAQTICRLALVLATSAASSRTELELVREQARRCSNRRGESASLLALALIAMRGGDDGAALASLREGLAVARGLGIRHVFWFLPDELADCCALALEHGIESAYVLELVRACSLAPGERARQLAAWPWTLRIEALGGFAVVRDGMALRPQRKEQRKPLEMLRLLVAQGPRGMRQDLLAEALWPDADGDAAHHALGTTLYRVRKLLGNPEAVTQADGRVALDSRSVFVDAWALESALDRAGAEPAPDRAEVLRRRVGERYRDALFGPDAEEPALAAARERLRDLVERCLAAR